MSSKILDHNSDWRERTQAQTGKTGVIQDKSVNVTEDLYKQAHFPSGLKKQEKGRNILVLSANRNI